MIDGNILFFCFPFQVMPTEVPLLYQSLEAVLCPGAFGRQEGWRRKNCPNNQLYRSCGSKNLSPAPTLLLSSRPICLSAYSTSALG